MNSFFCGKCMKTKKAEFYSHGFLVGRQKRKCCTICDTAIKEADIRRLALMRAELV